jgi:cobalt/nickel transport system permease protein
LHHLEVEGWSRGASPLHRRDARTKLAALTAFLIAVSTTPVHAGALRVSFAYLGYAALLISAAAASQVPLTGLLRRAALVLPFSATFALITWFSGDPGRALAIAEKSFLSGFGALLLIATTPLVQLLAALESLRVPRLLILVTQFVYRYLFVISEHAQHMRLAAQSRYSAGAPAARRFKAASGALGVLFARSWERADGIYRAMLARGFSGRFVPLVRPHLHAADFGFLAASVAACLAIRLSI